MTVRAALFLGAVVGAGLGGCAKHPLNARMTNDEIRAKVIDEFPPKMTVTQVADHLVALRVEKGHQHVYPPQGSRPQVLLARVFRPGGFWISPEDGTVEFVDVSFVFEPMDSLSRVLLFRDGVRYFEGGPAFGPSRPPMAPVRGFPAPIPPPMDPLEGAN